MKRKIISVFISISALAAGCSSGGLDSVSGVVPGDFFTSFTINYNGAAEIIPVSGIIDYKERTIKVAVPYGTDRSALVAAYTCNSMVASVEVMGKTQESGVTLNDFANDLVYDLELTDGTSESYRVTVEEGNATSKQLLAFWFSKTAYPSYITANIFCEVNESKKTITGFVPSAMWTALGGKFMPCFATTGESVLIGTATQTSGMFEIDFNSPQKYTVHAQDGSEVSYTVSIHALSITDESGKSVSDAIVSTVAEGSLYQKRTFSVKMLPGGVPAGDIECSSENSGIVDASSLGSSTFSFEGKNPGFAAVKIRRTSDPSIEATLNVVVHDRNIGLDAKTYNVNSGSYTMVYAGGGGISFVFGEDDTGYQTIENNFEIGRTEVTYQDWSLVMGAQTSVPYSFGTCSPRMGGTYTDGAAAADGFADQTAMPVTGITWMEAVVWCNRMTEAYNFETQASLTCAYFDEGNNAPIRDSTAVQNVIFDPSATGFRLPTVAEFEYAARYIGPNSRTYALTKNASLSSLTVGYYWTPAAYASGAAADYMNSTETGKVAIFNSNPGGTSWSTRSTKDIQPGFLANALGLYDMSGNVAEFCWDNGSASSSHFVRGGSYRTDTQKSSELGAGSPGVTSPPMTPDPYLSTGFRIVKNAK